MGAREFFRSLLPGRDRELAMVQYAGRESASDEAARKRRAQHARGLAQAPVNGRCVGGGA